MTQSTPAGEGQAVDQVKLGGDILGQVTEDAFFGVFKQAGYDVDNPVVAQKLANMGQAKAAQLEQAHQEAVGTSELDQVYDKLAAAGVVAPLDQLTEQALGEESIAKTASLVASSDVSSAVLAHLTALHAEA